MVSIGNRRHRLNVVMEGLESYDRRGAMGSIIACSCVKLFNQPGHIGQTDLNRCFVVEYFYGVQNLSVDCGNSVKAFETRSPTTLLVQIPGPINSLLITE